MLKNKGKHKLKIAIIFTLAISVILLPLIYVKAAPTSRTNHTINIAIDKNGCTIDEVSWHWVKDSNYGGEEDIGKIIKGTRTSASDGGPVWTQEAPRWDGYTFKFNGNVKNYTPFVFIKATPPPGYRYTGMTAYENGSADETKLSFVSYNGGYVVDVGCYKGDWANQSSGDRQFRDANSTVVIKVQKTPITYTVQYNGNGHTGGSTANSSHTYDSAKALTANGFTKTGCTFAGWSTSPSGSVSYSNGQSVKNLRNTQGATITLYAVWKPNNYTVSYNANGGTGSMSASTATYNSNFQTRKNTFTRTGYTFNGWNEQADGKHPEQWGLSNSGVYESGKYWKWTYAKSITLYAQWVANKYTVTYDANGGTGSMSASTATYDEYFITTKNGFEKTGYTFVGWNEQADGKHPEQWGLTNSGVYESGKSWKWKYAKSITLYAQWKDLTPPDVTLTASPSEWTNGPVTLTATAEDLGSGLKADSLVIKDSAGTIVAQGTDSVTYVDTSAGEETYTAEVYDNDDNMGVTSCESYIDYIPPTISGLQDEYDWTNQKKSLTAIIEDTGGSQLKNYIITDKTLGTIYQSGTLSTNYDTIDVILDIEQETIYSIKVFDNAGNSTSFSFKVKIDKTVPVVMPTGRPGNLPDDPDNPNNPDNTGEQLPTNEQYAKEFGWFTEDTALSFVVKEVGDFNSGIQSVVLTDLDTSKDLSDGLIISKESNDIWNISYEFNIERNERYKLTVTDIAGGITDVFFIVKIDKTAPKSIVAASLNRETDFMVAGWRPELTTLDKAIYSKGYDSLITIISQGSNDPTDVSGLKSLNVYLAEDCDENGNFVSDFFEIYAFDVDDTEDIEPGDYTEEYKEVINNIYSLDAIKDLGVVRIIAIAEDVAGNKTIAKTDQYMNFIIEGYVERAYESESASITKANQFFAGEKGVTYIKTLGYVDNVEIIFDSRFEKWLTWQKENMNSEVAAELKDMQLSMKFAVNPKALEDLKFIKLSYPKTTINVYSDSNPDAKLGYDFHVPFYAEQDEYTITLRAYKNGYSVDYDMDIIVGPSILKFFRTRIRVPSVLIDLEKELGIPAN